MSSFDPTLPFPKEEVVCRPPSIPIPSSQGQPDIELMDTFKFDDKSSSGPIRSHTVLPTDVYPADWDKRSIVEDAVIQSALQNADTTLVKTKTELVGDLRHTHLRCQCGKKHCSKKGKENPNPNSSDLWVKEGIKRDRIVQKPSRQVRAPPHRDKGAR